MNKTFNSVDEQRRIKNLLMNAMAVVRHPLVDHATEIDTDSAYGNGLKFYKTDIGTLPRPESPTDPQVSVMYIPSYITLGFNGLIEVHYEGSPGLLESGRLATVGLVNLDETIAIDRHFQYHRIGVRASEHILYADTLNNAGDSDEATIQVFERNERNLRELLDRLNSVQG